MRFLPILFAIGLGTFASCGQGQRPGQGNTGEHSASVAEANSEKTDEQPDASADTAGRTGTPASRMTERTANPHAFADFLGINAFEWDFLKDPTKAPDHPGLEIYEPKMNLIRSFSAVRHYLDWPQLEDQQGSYTFNPTRRGGWNYDTIYSRCKADGIFMVTCIQTTPDWLFNSYPAAVRDHDIIPAPYGANRENPGAYIAQARAGFQFAARYGDNKNLDSSLIHVNTTPRWHSDVPNRVKIGLGLVHYVECGNEPDKWWKGQLVQQNGRQYAANLSAFYDGHKGTMGPGVGVKNADPTMQVVMGGLARADVKFVRDMVDWCRENRGLNKDGSVNLCFDVLNFHLYSNDNLSWFNHFFKGASHGIAPEKSDEGDVAESFVTLSKELGGLPVWCSEVGYDLDGKSVQRAIPIGEKNAEMVQADWIIRTSLLYARLGLDRVFFYQLYDNDQQGEHSGIAFGKSGLVKPGRRKIAADYIVQLKGLMGNYHFLKTINADPLVDVYGSNEGKKIYVLLVPDQEDRKESYVLDLGGAKKASVYYLSPKSDHMKMKQVALPNGKLTLMATETPLFVKTEI